jgi:hypothetical protein
MVAGPHPLRLPSRAPEKVLRAARKGRSTDHVVWLLWPATATMGKKLITLAGGGVVAIVERDSM